MNEEETDHDVYFCGACGKSFTKLGDKLRHVNSEHPDYSTPYEAVPENIIVTEDASLPREGWVSGEGQ